MQPSTSGAQAVLQDQLTALFGNLGKAIAANTGGINRLEVSIMARLVSGGCRRMAELAEAEGLDRSTMSRRLAAMTERGLIDRAPDPEDGRAQLLRLTEHGRVALRHERDRRVALITDTLQGWSEREIADLATQLERLNEALETSSATSHDRKQLA